MFYICTEDLILNLNLLRQSICGYNADKDQRCDCKFGVTLKGEKTGCPELRQAIEILEGIYGDA